MASSRVRISRAWTGSAMMVLSVARSPDAGRGVGGGPAGRPLLGKLEIQQAPGGHVDRDRQLITAVVPLAGLAQSFVEDVMGEGADEPGALGQGDELVRRDQA